MQIYSSVTRISALDDLDLHLAASRRFKNNIVKLNRSISLV